MALNQRDYEAVSALLVRHAGFNIREFPLDDPMHRSFNYSVLLMDTYGASAADAVMTFANLTLTTILSIHPDFDLTVYDQRGGSRKHIIGQHLTSILLYRAALLSWQNAPWVVGFVKLDEMAAIRDKLSHFHGKLLGAGWLNDEQTNFGQWLIPLATRALSLPRLRITAKLKYWLQRRRTATRRRLEAS